jgi:hypothetical protein
VSIGSFGTTVRNATADAVVLSSASAGTSVRIDCITASYIASARSRSRSSGGMESRVSTAPVPAA